MLPSSIQSELLSLSKSTADTQSLIDELRQAINAIDNPIELRRYRRNIERLQGYVNEYSQRQQELYKIPNTNEQQPDTQIEQVSNRIQILHSELQQLRTTVDRVDRKADRVIGGQAILYESLSQMRREILDCYNVGEQRIIQNVIDTLDQHQMQLAQAMLNALNHLSQTQMEQVLSVVEAKVLLALPSNANEAAAIVKDTSLDIKHRLKVAIPLFPFVELESEMELGSGMNLTEALEKAPKQLWAQIVKSLSRRR